jgi:hypothetical protein
MTEPKTNINTVYEIAKQLEMNGHLSTMIRTGLVSPKIRFYLELYSKYIHFMQRGLKSREAVFQVTIVVGVNERTVWRAIKAMRTQNIDMRLHG